MEDEQQSRVTHRLIVFPEVMLHDKRLHLVDMVVYARMSQFDEYYESKDNLAEYVGKSVDVVVRSKQRLEKLGYIKCVKNDGHGKRYKAIFAIADYTDEQKEAFLAGKKRTRRSTKMTKDERSQWIKDKQDALDYWEKKKMPKIVANTTRNNYALARLLKNKNVGLNGIKKMLDYVAYKRGDICNVNPIKVSDWCDLEYKANGIMDKAIKFSQR